MIAIILGILLSILGMGNSQHVAVAVIPPMPQYSADELFEDCLCDECCWAEAYDEFADEFTALFNSYQVKRAKNGALMIRRGSSGSYTFARKS